MTACSPTRYGIGTIDMVHQGVFGCMAALRGTDIISVPLQEAINKRAWSTRTLIEVAASLHPKVEKKQGEEEAVNG